MTGDYQIIVIDGLDIRSFKLNKIGNTFFNSFFFAYFLKLLMGVPHDFYHESSFLAEKNRLKKFSGGHSGCPALLDFFEPESG